jgi:uncharacterized OB-fold protein
MPNQDELRRANPILPDVDFAKFLEAGKFMLLRSKSSKNYFFYPRIAEPQTGNLDLEWMEASGKGTVYSTTTVMQKPPAANYNVVLVDLEEGPRLMSRVSGIEPEKVTIGMPVRAKIEKDDKGSNVLVFIPA